MLKNSFIMNKVHIENVNSADLQIFGETQLQNVIFKYCTHLYNFYKKNVDSLEHQNYIFFLVVRMYFKKQYSRKQNFPTRNVPYNKVIYKDFKEIFLILTRKRMYFSNVQSLNKVVTLLRDKTKGKSGCIRWRGTMIE